MATSKSTSSERARLQKELSKLQKGRGRHRGDPDGLREDDKAIRDLRAQINALPKH